MLRLLVLLLFIANLAFYGWTQGWMDAWLPRGPAHEGAQRLARQVHPERVRIDPMTPVAPADATAPDDASAASGSAASAAASAASAAPVGGVPSAAPAAASSPLAAASAAPIVAAAAPPGLCLEAGPYSSSERDRVEARLRGALSAAVWTVQSVQRPGSWLVYMGPYPDADLMARKKDELRRLGIAYQDQRTPPTLNPGLALGRFDDRKAADAALLKITERGVRSARVVTMRAPQDGYVLRFAQASPALRIGLSEMGAEAFLGRPPQACKPAA